MQKAPNLAIEGLMSGHSSVLALPGNLPLPVVFISQGDEPFIQYPIIRLFCLVVTEVTSLG